MPRSGSGWVLAVTSSRGFGARPPSCAALSRSRRVEIRHGCRDRCDRGGTWSAILGERGLTRRSRGHVARRDQKPWLRVPVLTSLSGFAPTSTKRFASSSTAREVSDTITSLSPWSSASEGGEPLPRRGVQCQASGSACGLWKSVARTSLRPPTRRPSRLG